MMCPMMGDPKVMACMMFLKLALILWILYAPMMVVRRLDQILKLMQEDKK